MRLSWDGTLQGHRVWGDVGGPLAPERLLAEVNVRDIADVGTFLHTLPL